MASLIATTACGELLPVFDGGFYLRECAPLRITSVAPFAGCEAGAGQVLGRLGLGWPAPGRQIAAGEAACLWSARGQALLLGAAPDGLEPFAALTDQTDGWARIRIEAQGSGRSAAEVLARLVPLDLSPGAFPEDGVARTGLGQIPLIVSRAGTGFDLMVYRSMAASAIADLRRAMAAVGARALLR